MPEQIRKCLHGPAVLDPEGLYCTVQDRASPSWKYGTWNDTKALIMNGRRAARRIERPNMA
jgi:hypothetical protein